MANPKEWSNDYNGFNDWKILLHKDKLEGCATGDLLAPIAVDTDPSNICQQRCIYCNAYDYRDKSGFENMPPGHLLKLADFYADWGVKSTCIAGGGEPLVNKDTLQMIPRLHKHNIEVGMITNGALLDERYAEELTNGARFCGISIDGTNEETYKRMRGQNHYKQVVKNVTHLNETKYRKGSKLDTNLKFLIHPFNYEETYKIAKLAKDTGCDGVHIRPAGLENIPGVVDYLKPENNPGFDIDEYMKITLEHIEKAYELEDENFKVYAVRHKFGKNFKRVVKFDSCKATPLSGVFGADGWFHICFSRRGRKGFRLARHYPDPWEIMRVWGSEDHMKLINDIQPDKCMRCAFTRYNEVIENVIEKDKIFGNFI